MQTKYQNLNKNDIPFILILLGCGVSVINSFFPYMVFSDPTIGQVTYNGTAILPDFLVLEVAVIIAVFSAFKYRRAIDEDDIRSSRKLILIAFIISLISLVLYDLSIPEVITLFVNKYGIPQSGSFGLGFYGLIYAPILFFIGLLTINNSLVKVKKSKTPLGLTNPHPSRNSNFEAAMHSHPLLKHEYEQSMQTTKQMAPQDTVIPGPFCSNCGAHLVEYLGKCLKCGAKQNNDQPMQTTHQMAPQDMVIPETSCSNCGAHLIENLSFCLKCGAKQEN